MKDQPIHSVLTGDIIKSSKLDQPDLEKVRACLLDSVADVKKWKKGLLKSKPEFFRGDSWQLLLSDPGQALRVAVFLRASLLSHGMADTRISIGIGPITKVSPQRVSLSTGKAFEYSGEALDKMASHARMTIAGSPVDETDFTCVSLVVELCDALIARWTRRQPEAICLAAVPREATHETMAGEMKPPVKRQTFSDTLNGASWHALESAIEYFEKLNWEDPTKP